MVGKNATLRPTGGTMWIVAGVLLGAVVLASVAGFHLGPHAHMAAAVIGVLAAAWLVLMAMSSYGGPVLWVLLSADVVIATGIGVMGWVSLTRTDEGTGRSTGRLEGDEGTAVSDLTPEGIVRVRGEEWSAESVNGTVAAGSRVQVLRTKGVRLEVWAEGAETSGRHAGSGALKSPGTKEEQA
jgi:membrane-bound ClpP family serine protease